MPILVLSGNSELSKDKRVESIKEDFKGNYVRIHPEDSDKIPLILSYTKNLGMFSQKVVLDILDFDSWKSKDKKELLSELKHVPDDIFVIIRSKKAIKGLNAENFPLPKPWEREKWLDIVKRNFEEKGLRISEETANYFLDVVGQDEYRIESEVKKLALYCREEVKIEDINEVTYRSTHAAIDDLCFAISEGRVGEAHRILPDVLRSTETAMLVASIARHFEDLFKLKLVAKLKEKYSWPDVSRYSKELGIPLPKVARFLGFKFKGWRNKPFNHLSVYSKEDLVSILKRIYTLDRVVKSGESPEVHLHSFIESFRGELSVRYDSQDASR